MPSTSSICVFQCFPKLSWICWATWNKWHYPYRPYHSERSIQNKHHQCPHDPYPHDKGNNHCSCHRHGLCFRHMRLRLLVAWVSQEDNGDNDIGDDQAQPKPVCQSQNWCGYYCWYYPPCCCLHFGSPRRSHCWRSWLRNTSKDRHKWTKSWSPKCCLWMLDVVSVGSINVDIREWLRMKNHHMNHMSYDDHIIIFSWINSKTCNNHFTEPSNFLGRRRRRSHPRGGFGTGRSTLTFSWQKFISKFRSKVVVCKCPLVQLRPDTESCLLLLGMKSYHDHCHLTSHHQTPLLRQ